MDGGPVQCFEGRQRNSFIVHCGDGYFYHIREVRRRDSRVRLQCRHFSAGCRATASVCLATGFLHHLNPHFHDPDPLLVEDFQLRRNMIAEARNHVYGKKILNILNEWKVRTQNVHLASRFTTVRMRSALYTARSDSYPAIPNTLLHLGCLLSTPNMQPLCTTVDGNDHIFQGIAGNALDRTIALVFVSGRMLQFLQSRGTLFSDGTFKKRSKKPKMSQIFNIVAKYGDNIIGVVRVLMTSRTTQAYVAVLDFLKSLVPNLQNNLRVVHCDFERAQMIAWRQVFPNCQVAGCLWHYAVAFCSHARTLGLAPIASENPQVFDFLRCLAGVPLLPHHLIRQGVIEIWREVEETGWQIELRPLFQYFRREWFPRRLELSVYGYPDRTNNCSESDNHTLANMIPQNRPNIWHLLGAFSKLEHLAFCDKIAIDDQRPVRGSRKWKTVWNDALVRRSSLLLDMGHITPGHFLHRASYAIHAAVLQGLRLRNQNESDASDSE